MCRYSLWQLGLLQIATCYYNELQVLLQFTTLLHLTTGQLQFTNNVIAIYDPICSDEQKSARKNLVKFGTRYVSVYVARAPAVKIVKWRVHWVA